jgi:soluble cytochrome b562
MSELEIIIEGLSDKVRKLGDRQRILVAENERLRSANEQLEVEISTQKKANHILDEQNKVAKIAKSVSPDTEGRKEERKKLNELVREIDKCIALLNN